MLFTCVLLGLSSAPIFAASEEDNSSGVFPVGFYEDQVYDKFASDTRAVDPGTTYTIDDIYRVLNNNIRIGMTGQSATSAYSLPRIASYLVTNLGGGDVSVGNLVGELSMDTIDIKTYTSYLPNISNSIDALRYITWQNTNATYLGAKRSPTGSVVSSWVTGEKDWFFGFNFGGSTYSSNQPMTLRLWVPFDPWNQIGSPNFRLKSIQYVASGTAYPVNFDNANVFFEPATSYGTYVYIFNFKDYNLGYTDIYFEVEYLGSGSPQMSGDRSGSAYFIPFDSVANQQLKVAFYQSTISDDISSLANYLVSPSKQAAENASQAVIDDTLDGFTGNGSAAAKTSDTGSMKNMSGSIQNGLNSGASASNAASVFSNQTFWSWFTQSTSDGINNPYPAPVVQNNRAPGDYVPDFLSGNQAELQDLLNQRNSW